jgi:hypothetical protein
VSRSVGVETESRYTLIIWEWPILSLEQKPPQIHIWQGRLGIFGFAGHIEVYRVLKREAQLLVKTTKGEYELETQKR